MTCYDKESCKYSVWRISERKLTNKCLITFAKVYLCGVSLNKKGTKWKTKTLNDLHLAKVVQTLDSAIHRINRYPADKY